MKKYLIIITLFLVPSIMMAQVAGGTIKRQKEVRKSKNKTIVTKANATSINVSTEEQFLKALGNNRTIVIQKSINLSSIIDHELVLSKYNNLSIKGVDPSIRLGVSKGENLVLYFDSCQNVSISNLIIGHENVLWCGAGVLMYSKCSGIRISNCDIYGCGYYGIVFSRSNDIVCENSKIHNCHVYLLGINNSKNVRIIKSVFKESVMGTMISAYSSENVTFESCTIIDDTHTGEEMYGHKCFSLNCNINLKNCVIHYTNTYGDRNYIRENGCTWY